MVQPAPTPWPAPSPGTNSEVTSSANDAGSSQNEMLFMRGNAMSGAPIMSGTIQLPKPPIMAGMTTKKKMSPRRETDTRRGGEERCEKAGGQGEGREGGLELARARGDRGRRDGAARGDHRAAARGAVPAVQQKNRRRRRLCRWARNF